VTLAAMELRIQADDGVFRNFQVVIDDAVPEAAMRAHLHAGE
jgi:hypothetical protein